MEWILTVIIIVIFVAFLALWFSGVFNTKKYVNPGSTGTQQIIKDNINILMPPSTWSVAGTTGQCLIYNFPIVGGKFPNVTNSTSVIPGLQSTTSNRCYWSNELGLQKSMRTCNSVCYDDMGNSYGKGDIWTYYNPCGNSCYSNGEYISLIVIALESDDFTPKAFQYYAYGGGTPGGTVVASTPNLQQETQYHRVLRYSTINSTSATTTNGRYCNIVSHTSGNYLTITKIENEGDIYYRPNYTSVKPTKCLWFMAPPNSLGGTAQSQKLIFINGLNMGTNPPLNQYAGFIQSNSLTSIGYGLNPNIRQPFVDLFMIDAMAPKDLDQFSTNIQFVDISRYDILMNSSTTTYPFYRWSSK